MIRAALLLLALAAPSAAHLGFAVSSRVDLSGERPVVSIWVDAGHVAGTRAEIVAAVTTATHLRTGEGSCRASETRDGGETQWLILVEMTFDCSAPPVAAELDAPTALSAGPLQYVEIVLPHETRGGVHPARADLVLDAVVANRGVLPWIGGTGVAGLLALLALVVLRGRGRAAPRDARAREDNP